MKWLLVVAVALAAAACGRTVYVPVELGTTGRDSVRIAVLRSDTVVIETEREVRVDGDTVRIVEWRERRSVSVRVDTVERLRVDTVRVAVPVPTATSRGGVAGVAGVLGCVIIVVAGVMILKALRR